jgi:hypothetical protein
VTKRSISFGNPLLVWNSTNMWPQPIKRNNRITQKCQNVIFKFKKSSYLKILFLRKCYRIVLY